MQMPLESPVALSALATTVLVLLSANLRVSRCFDDLDGDLGGIGDNDSATALPSSKTQQSCGLTQLTLLQRPPYVMNISNMANLGMIQVVLAELQCMDAPCSISEQTFYKAKDQKELHDHLLRNKSDIVFPYVTRKGQMKVLKKPFLAILDHPGLSLLVIPSAPDPVATCLETIVSSWPLLALSVIFTGISGIIIWLCEVLSNRDEFPPSFTKGSWEGFWWAFISMTTVGYGDKSPRTIAGRCFSVIWIMIGLVLVTVFMANVTTALTAVSVSPVYDLANMQVAVYRNSTDDIIASDEGAKTQAFDNFDDMVASLRSGKINGILVDRYTAGYYLRQAQMNKRPLNISVVKQIPVSGYSIGLVVGNKKMNDFLVQCRILGDQELSEIYGLDYLREQAVIYAKKESTVPLAGSSSATTKKSFNLFVYSRKAIYLMVYVSLGVLASMISIGCLVEFIINRKHRRQSSTVSLELKSITEKDVANANNHMERELAEGRKKLTELQNYFDRLEQLLKAKIHRLAHSTVQSHLK